jgi:hypothetical protein
MVILTKQETARCQKWKSKEPEEGLLDQQEQIHRTRNIT